MVDIFTKKKRSHVMSRIRSKSGLDRKVHNWLKGMHIRHEMYPKIVGNPDIKIIGNRNFYIFLDSCFWHGCSEHYHEPKSSFCGVDWRRKIERNKERDLKRASLLYKWLTIWEHDVKSGAFKDKITRTLSVETP